MKIDNPMIGQIERGLSGTPNQKTPLDKTKESSSFSDMIEEAVNKVNKLQFEANRSVAEIGIDADGIAMANDLCADIIVHGQIAGRIGI